MPGDDEPDLDTTLAPLVGEPEPGPVNPVVVTTGTCRARGYRPIATEERCDQADAILFADHRFTSGPLDTPPVLDASGNPSPSFSPTPACSVGTRAPSTAGAPSELLAIFRTDTPEAMDAQACSHDHPCVCDDVGQVAEAPATVETETVSACRDGVFRPDPKRYYTIKSPNGRYLRSLAGTISVDSIFLGTDMLGVIYTPIDGDALQPYTQDYDTFAELFGKTELINTSNDARFQWRFELADDGYRPISRDSGRPLTVNHSILSLVAESAPTTPFTFACRGSQIVMRQGGFSPIDTGGRFADSTRTSFMSTPLVMGTPRSPGKMTRVSTCMKKSRSCSSTFGPEFVQTGRELCGAFDQLHRLTCTNTLDVPVSMQVPQAWYVDEVSEFKRAANFDLAPITVAPLTSASAVSNSLATFGASAASTFGGVLADAAADALIAGSGPLVGAMVSLGLGFIPGGAFDFNQPDPVAELADAVTRALEKLRDDLTTQTELLIANAFGRESDRQLMATLISKREDFYVDYLRLRSVLTVEDVSAAASLHANVRGLAQVIDTSLDTFFPRMCAQPCQLDDNELRRAHFGLVSAKLAMTEEMFMESETILMQALAEENRTCDAIFNANSLEFHADKYRRLLTNAVDGLVAHGLAASANRVNRSALEFEFDARNFSYDIETQLVFFDRIIENTRAKCERLRDPDDAFRRHFIENTLDIPPCFGDDATGDSDGSGTCDGAVAAMAGPWTELATPGSIAEIAEPILADVDGDGDLDLMTRHLNPRRLVQWTNADGVLAEGPSVATSCKPFDLELSDLDGDGDLDLLAGGNSSNTFVFAEHAGAGPGVPTLISSGLVIKSVLAMAVDGDARPDLVVFDAVNQQLLLHLNATGGEGIELAAATVIDGSLSSTTFAGPGLAAIDVDADGDLDLVVATSQLTLYLNEGGTFSAPATIDQVDLGSNLYLADLDRDGDDDLVGVTGGRAVWYENLGVGGFGAQRSVAGSLSAGALAVGDLDGDGDTDVVVRDAGTGQLVWIENGNRGLVVRAPVGVAPAAFAIGDVDGDGDGDVVAVNPASSGLVTWLNPLF